MSEGKVAKNITIRKDQNKWLKENHLNLSSFVREKLDERIKKIDGDKNGEK